MISGFCLQPLPGQTQGQLVGQPTLFAVNLAATATAADVNICEGAGRASEVPVNYAFRMAPERSQRRPEWLGRIPIEESQTLV
jgi:hypothetical protein